MNISNGFVVYFFENGSIVIHIIPRVNNVYYCGMNFCKADGIVDIACPILSSSINETELSLHSRGSSILIGSRKTPTLVYLQVLKMFPSTLQTDICLHIHDELLRHNSAFRAAVPSCKRSLASKLKVQHFLPRQYIVKQGDPVDKVIFILKGTVDVIGDGQKIVAIGRGEI